MARRPGASWLVLQPRLKNTGLCKTIQPPSDTLTLRSPYPPLSLCGDVDVGHLADVKQLLLVRVEALEQLAPPA